MGVDNAATRFEGRVANGSWLVITGHGTYDGGFKEVVGESLHVDSNNTPIPIKCSAKDYVDLVMNNSKLESGDSVNLMLFICNSGKRGSKDEPSFAEQLAALFAERNISTHIVAAIGIAPRYSSVPANKTIDYTVERHKRDPGEAVVFDTDYHTKKTTSYTPVSSAHISRTGIHEAVNPYFNALFCSDERAKKIISDLHEELCFHNIPTLTNFATFLMSREQVEAMIMDHPANAIIHLSENLTYALTYIDAGKVLHKQDSNLDKLIAFMNEKKLIEDDHPLTSSLVSSNENLTSSFHNVRGLGLFSTTGSLSRSGSLDLSSSGKRLLVVDNESSVKPKDTGLTEDNKSPPTKKR